MKQASGSASRQTPAEIIELLNKEINAGFADPTLNARLGELGGTALKGTPGKRGSTPPTLSRSTIVLAWPSFTGNLCNQASYVWLVARVHRSFLHAPKRAATLCREPALASGNSRASSS
jgi:hypothetical protein